MKVQRNVQFLCVMTICIVSLTSCHNLSANPNPTQKPGITEEFEPVSLPSQESTEATSELLPQDIEGKYAGLDIEEFFEVSFRELLRRDPELIVELGLSESIPLETARLTDVSQAYKLETQQLETEILEMLRTYDRSSLTPEQRVSYDVYETYLDDRMWAYTFSENEYLVTFLVTNGVQIQLLNFLTEIHPVENRQDALDYLSRLDQVDEKIESILEGLKTRQEAGIIPPKLVIQWSIGDIQDIARGPAKLTPYYTAFEEKVSEQLDISGSEKQALLASAEEAINDAVIPAYAELAHYLEKLERQAPSDDGVWQFPEGEDYYEYTLNHFTTTDLSADEIHQIGQQELERIQGGMREIFDDLGYPLGDSIPGLYERAARESGMVAGAEMAETYEQIITKAEKDLNPVFDMMPRAKLVVIGGVDGDYYQPGSLDGARPGAFYARTTTSNPRLGLPTLAYHEGVPGHHFQISIAQEADLPTFRNVLHFTAYTEGWALYAERLAKELGWYENDPYGDLGRLQAEAFRAARLVVDTGIHSKGWTYDEAVDYMIENTGLPPRMVNIEIGRYIAWPGQSTAYMTGMLKILELRQNAMDQLGDKFDIKEFHKAILLEGAVPLNVLETVVQDYIDTKLAE